MRTLFLFIAICATSLFASAQDSIKVKEFGFTQTNPTRAGLTFRFGTKTALWRVSIPFVSNTNKPSFVYSDSYNYRNIKQGLIPGINMEREWRKPISKRADFCLGGGIGLNQYEESNYYRSTINDYDSFQPEDILVETNSKVFVSDLHLILGINYTLENNIKIGVEVQPFMVASIYRNSTRQEVNEKNNRTYKSTWGRIGHILNLNYALYSITYQF